MNQKLAEKGWSPVQKYAGLLLSLFEERLYFFVQVMRDVSKFLFRRLMFPNITVKALVNNWRRSADLADGALYTHNLKKLRRN